VERRTTHLGQSPVKSDQESSQDASEHLKVAVVVESTLGVSTERNSGLRALLTRPAIYEAFQRAVGARKFRQAVLDRYLRTGTGVRVLDIGCGPGDLASGLPHVDYVGFDPNSAYIASAKARFGSNARFFVGDVCDIEPAELGQFDWVVALGVLHHLDAAASRCLFDLAASVLSDDGRLITVDPCISPRQSFLARAIVTRDRGENVRTADEYRALATLRFRDVHVTEHHDLLNVPFTHLAMECAGAHHPESQDRWQQ
jgi:SAM-dependent methyltransferase